jgi:hypothetical protein
MVMASLASAKKQPAYVGKMMERLGIEQGGGIVPRWSLNYATALHRCESCPSKRACRKWLDATPAPTAFAPSFCPNADILFELQFDQLGRQPIARGGYEGATRWHG